MFKYAFYNHFIDPIDRIRPGQHILPAGRNMSRHIILLAFTPEIVIRRHQGFPASHQRLYPASTPATISLRAFTPLNCLYYRLRVLSSLFDLCIPVFVRKGYTLIAPDLLTYCRPQDRKVTYEIAIV
jgi:hypothetical protein